MEILSTGSGVNPVESVQLLRLRAVTAHPEHARTSQPVVPHAPADSNAALIGEIAPADIAKLTAILEPTRSPEIAAHVNDLTRDTTLALNESDRVRALANLDQIAAIDPHSLAVLEPEKVLQPVRAEVDHILTRLTTVAKMDAEGWLAHADDALEAPGHASIPNWQTKPETLLHVAHRLFDSGGYENYVHSADLAKTILNTSPLEYSPWLAAQGSAAQAIGPKSAAPRIEDDEPRLQRPVIPTVHKTLSVLRTAASPRIRILWQRAPLLVLLLSWFAIGLVAGTASILLRTLAPESWPASLIDFGFETWALGFLALVCFGFYARIRDIRA